MSNVYLMVRRQKMTIFLEATDISTLLEVKKMVGAIVKKKPEQIGFYLLTEAHGLKDRKPVLMEDKKTLADYELTENKASAPACLGLVFREGKTLEALDIATYTDPPPLPDSLRNSKAIRVGEGDASQGEDSPSGEREVPEGEGDIFAKAGATMDT